MSLEQQKNHFRMELVTKKLSYYSKLGELAIYQIIETLKVN